MSRLPAVGLCLALAQPAFALEPPVEPNAEIAIQQCMEAVHAGQIGGEIPEPTGHECIGLRAAACQRAAGQSAFVIRECSDAEELFWVNLAGAHQSALRDYLPAETFAGIAAAHDAWDGYRQARCAVTLDLWQDTVLAGALHAQCMMEQMADYALWLESIINSRIPR